ncbi:MAG: hypothetical protein NXI10_14390 [bacterium]|nr:hypothetical protein [bacterium]
MLNDLISIMTPSDKEQFLRFLSERNRRKEGRSLALFKALSKGREPSLKVELGSNAYNVLKMRLTNTLSEFLSMRVFEGELTLESQIIRLLALARKMLQLGKLASGRKLLIKAESKAIEIQHYTLLNEIYHSLIEISHEAPFVEQQELINKLEANTHNFLLQERLNLVFARVKRAFKEGEQGKQQVDLNALVQENFSKYGISESNGFRLKSLYQLATILDYAAAQTRSYHAIELFFADKIEQLSSEEINNERNHLYHIDLLYLLANIHFRQRSFKLSMQYLDKMHKQLHAFDGKFYQDRIVKHQLLLALNQNFQGDAASALSTLDQVQFSSKEDTLEKLQVDLTHAMILAQQERYNEARTILKKHYRTDSYYKRIAGLEWLVNKRFLEIVLQVELGNLDFAYGQIDNFLRQQKDFFSDPANEQIKPFLKVFKQYLNQPNIIHTDAFHQQIERTIPWKEAREEDIFFMSVYGWFKAKMLNEKVYNTTLELIH